MINRSPDQIDLYPLLANAYAELGKKSEVIQTLAELKQALNQTRIHYAMGFRNMALGDTYLAAEQFDEAIDSYKKAMEFEPMSERVCKEKLIKAYTKAGKTNLAEELRATLGVKSKD